MTTSHPVVDGYVAAVNASDLAGLVGLFAPSAVLRHPLGTFSGPEEIEGFYRDVVLAGQAVVAAGSVLHDESLVMAEITATSPLDPEAGTAYAIDVFRVDGDGRIEVLEIYYR